VLFTKAGTHAVPKKKNCIFETLFYCTERQAPLLYRRRKIGTLETLLYRRADTKAVQKERKNKTCAVQQGRHPCCTEEERVDHLKPCFNVQQEQE
jgi:hypothetical protein